MAISQVKSVRLGMLDAMGYDTGCVVLPQAFRGPVVYNTVLRSKAYISIGHYVSLGDGTSSA